MLSNSSDRNLLFGVIALQMDFIKRDQLIEAMTAWATDKSKSLGQVLVEKKQLSDHKRNLLEQLVNVHLQDHDGNAEKSLEAICSLSPMKSDLQTLTDEDVQRIVMRLPNPMATQIQDSPILQSTMEAAVEFKGLRFEILRPHAKGGLGEVFVALDTELDREVALKEIQLRHANHQNSRERFVLEAQVTGKLEHPGIVPVYGLGHYPDGRPYYAMRLVNGDSLSEAIASFHKRDWSENPSGRSVEFRKLLGRFVDVCQAVEYAHCRGVLHRDLKPANVMLGKYGETLVVDWGLARVLDTPEVVADDGTLPIKLSAGSSTDLTQAGSAIGTPAYMSPEQAEGKLEQLGPATDIYSLGATLYAILTGRAPLDEKEVGEVLRKVARGEIPPPRSIEPTIPKPLEAICKKAMSLSPSDRYSRCSQLADDVEHWLADEPTSAAKDSLAVRVQRWSRKNPGPVSAIAAAVLVSVFGLLSGLYFVDLERRHTGLERDAKDIAQREEQKQREAAEAKRQEAEDQRKLAQSNEKKAEQEKERAVKILEHFIESFQKADPTQDGYKLTVAEMLPKAAESARRRFQSDPMLEATLLHAIDKTMYGLGLIKERLPITERVMHLLTQAMGPDHIDTIVAIGNFGVTLKAAGHTEKAIVYLEQSYEKTKALYGADHTRTATILVNLIGAYVAAGKTINAIPLLEQSYKTVKTNLGADSEETLRVMNSLANAYFTTGQFDRAIPLCEEAIKHAKVRFGENHFRTASLISNLALAHQAVGQTEKAIPLLEQCLEKKTASFGPDHPETLTSTINLGLALLDSSKPKQAIPLLEQGLKKRKNRLGPEHPETLTATAHLASGLLADNQVDRAIELLQQTIEKQKRIIGGEHPETLRSICTLGWAFAKVKRNKEAEEQLRIFVDKVVLKERPWPANVKVKIPSTLDFLIGYHDSLGNKSEADKHRELRKKYPDRQKKGYGKAVQERKT